jgi:hypothetical protein
MSDPTPGQIAYEAYLSTWPHTLLAGLRAWQDEPPIQQRAWEAAAQAVLAAQEAPRVPEEPPFCCSHGGLTERSIA